MVDISPGEIAEAVNALETMHRHYRLFETAMKAADTLRSYTNAKADLDTAVAARRAELAALNAQTIDSAVAEGKRAAALLIAECGEQIASLTAAAQQKVADADAALVAKGVELAALQDQITALKSRAAALAGA